MTTINLCPDLPIPTYKGIHDAVMQAIADLMKLLPEPPYLDFKYPPFKLTFPSLPTMPSVGFGISFDSALHAMEMFINELCSHQLMAVLSAIVEEIIALIPGFTLPKIPHLDIDIIELFSWDIDLMFPTLNLPDFPDLSLTFRSPSMNKLRALQKLVTESILASIDAIVGILGDLADILFPSPLTPPGLPSFPDFPFTFAGLLAMLPPLPKFSDLFDISLPGLDISLILPTIIIPNCSLGLHALMQGILALLKGIASFYIDLIVGFFEDLGISLSLPTICFPFQANPNS